MTRFAANLTMLFNDVPFTERFRKAADSGFKAVEFLFPYDWQPDVLAGLLKDYGLEQALFNMPPGNWDAGERGLAALPGREEEFRQGARLALTYARALNCHKVHAMSGVMDPRFSRADHEQSFVENIRYAADLMREDRIDVLIEPLNCFDMPGYFISHQQEAVALIHKVDRPNVKLQFDLYHAQIMDGNICSMIRAYAPVIGHIQAASVPGRHEPDKGELNLPVVLEQLDSSGYAGWVGCEYVPSASTEEGLGWLKAF